ncbi:hypothetical protein OAY01_03145 [Luminiphilus sp.]|nr:hypothetical protein [Luminiphilus sp.]
MNDRFDWFPTLLSPELGEKARYVTALILEGSNYNSKGASEETRSLKYNQTAAKLISALYIAHCSSEAVSVPLSPRHFHKTKVGKVRLSQDYTVKVYNKLLELGWIEIIIPPKAKENVTGIQSSGELEQLFKDLGIRWMPQELLPHDELVILRDVQRDRDGVPIRSTKKRKTKRVTLITPENGLVEQWRENLQKINKVLIQHCISIDLDNQKLMLLQNQLANNSDNESFRSLQMHRVQLVRIFSRGSLEKGGRFYRGWWQSIPEIHRPHIRIDGKKVVEVDYSGMSLRICNALMGAPLPSEVDPYDIGLPDWEGSTDSRRKTLKKVINAFINDEDGVYRLPKEAEKILGLTEEDLRQQFKSHYPKLYSKLGDGIGLLSQYIDSKVAEKVMLTMIDEGSVVLPIHDSFIVTLGDQSRVCTVMREVFQEFTGAETALDVDVIKLNEHFGMEASDVEQLSQKVTAGIVSASDLLDSVKNYHNKITNKYLSYWEKSRR